MIVDTRSVLSRPLQALVVAGIVAGCRSTVASPPRTPAVSTAPVSVAEATLPDSGLSNDTLVFTGMCDASAAIALSEALFVVADDEDNVLRVYDSRVPGPPVRTTDLSAFLGTDPEKPKEADIEAATRVGDVGLWLASHGRNRKGRAQPTRLQLFATSLPVSDSIAPLGQPYRRLLDDMLAAPQLASLQLASAARIAPKDPGGLNLEGMTARHDGQSVLIGFRNPLVNGRAIVVALLNPRAIVEGEPAQLGEPTLLDLGGLGVRDLARWGGQYLVVAGAIGGERTTRLFLWDGESGSATPLDNNVNDLNPEAMLTYGERPEVLVLSDDGSLIVDGEECKRLTDPTRKRFRARWFHIAQP